jgi:hypothetical protein
LLELAWTRTRNPSHLWICCRCPAPPASRAHVPPLPPPLGLAPPLRATWFLS